MGIAEWLWFESHSAPNVLMFFWGSASGGHRVGRKEMTAAENTGFP